MDQKEFDMRDYKDSQWIKSCEDAFQREYLK